MIAPILGLLSALLLIFVHAPFSFWPLAWIALLPLLLALHKCKWWQALLISWGVGLGFFGFIASWLPAWRLDAFFGTWLGTSLFLALFGIAAWTSQRVLKPGLRVLAIPAAWLGLDWLFSLTPLSSYWAGIGYNQPLLLLQIVSVVGLSGFTVFVIAVNAFFAESLVQKKLLRWPGIVLIALLLITAVYGIARLQYSPEGTLPVAIVQPNVPNEWEWREAHLDELLDIYQNLAMQAKGADLIVLPQYSLPGEIRDIKQINMIAQETGAYLILGTYRDDVNIAPLYNPEGEIVGEYSAVVLPPFRRQIAGEEFMSFALDGTRMGVLLCYDDTSPDAAKADVAMNAAFLVDMMNDNLFLDTTQPEMHFTRARMRAIEMGRTVLRASPSGRSAVIDARGRVLEDIPIGKQGVIKRNIALSQERTVYSWIGDMVPLLGAIVFIILLLVAWKRRH